tara:strand:+ start:2093 stop:2398 length:306 start_codon:yes stop_codon:yes gene_type:complete
MKKMYVVLFAVDSASSKRRILKYVVDTFGGYSLTTMQGGWYDSCSKCVIEEPSYKLEIITSWSRLRNKVEDEIKLLCEFIKKVACQSEVYYYELDVKIKVV